MKYFIMMHGWRSADDCTYVLTESDVKQGGWTDIQEENFLVASRQEAETVKARLQAYCQERGYDVRIGIVEA